MIILPAIDLYDGQAVRLLRGDYDQRTVYSDKPVEVAKSFVAAGAHNIHLVDLAGARDGGTPAFALIAQIVRETGLSAEVGGGIRSAEDVGKYLDAGVRRVILGTAAVVDKPLLRSLVDTYQDRIAVGVDVRDGRVAIKGWREMTDETLEDFCTFLEDAGVQTIICTDISKDGAMQGTNRKMYADLADRFDLNIVASGGITTIDDVRALRDMGLWGAILGRAIYSGDIDLREAIEACA